ncbi:hypothetical protein DSUL_100204 [Desulfovibrionales bacterium]
MDKATSDKTILPVITKKLLLLTTCMILRRPSILAFFLRNGRHDHMSWHYRQYLRHQQRNCRAHFS